MKLLLALLVAALPWTGSTTDLKPFQRDSWQALRLAHAGRPLIVHFWGVTCGPCLIELPRWGEFIGEKPGPDIIMIAADPVPAEPAVLTEILSKAGCASTENWMFSDRFTERLTYGIDPTWRGELPYTLLIGADGSVTSMVGQVEFATIREWAAQQLGGPHIPQR